MRRAIEVMHRGGGRYNNHGRGGGGGRGRGRGGRQHRGSGRGGGGSRGRHAFQNDRNNRRPNAGNNVHDIGTTGAPSPTSFTVAVQGCSHGELDSIYDALEAYRVQKLTPSNERDPNAPVKDIDVLLCCGDVQTLRNAADLHSLNVPPKYKTMGDFHAYYSGQKVAPVLTIMIGGNHESSNYLQELFYGGWVAPNIYYLGAAGVVNLCKRTTTGDASAISTLRIAGISGIYNSRHYRLGRFETPPYDQGALRSVYHTREADVKRLRALATAPSATAAATHQKRQQQTIGVMISHDWPRGIAYHGNTRQLLQRKPFFRSEVESNELGSPANEELLHALKPEHWFAAHLHVKFEALVRHGSEGSGNMRESCLPVRKQANGAALAGSKPKAEPPAGAEPEGEEDEIPLPPAHSPAVEFHGMESNNVRRPAAGLSVENLTDQMTRFLSLDKCLPRRRHIQITHAEPSSSRSAANTETAPSQLRDEIKNNEAWLEYDAPWLAVLRRTHGWTQRTRRTVVAEDGDPITEEEIDDVAKRFEGRNDDNLAIPLNFTQTVPPFDPSAPPRSYGPPPPMVGNPQTDRLLETLGLDHRITVPFAGPVQQEPSFFFRQPPPPIHSRSNDMRSRSMDDENEIDLDDDQEETEGSKNVPPPPPLLPPSAPPQQLIPSALIHGRSNNSVPSRMEDENEIDLDNNPDEAGGSNIQYNNMQGAVVVNDAMQDPAEIDLEEEEDGNAHAKHDAGGDYVCFSPSGSVAKKPRTEC